MFIQEKISTVIRVVKIKLVWLFRKKHLLKCSGCDVLNRMSFLIDNFPHSLFCLRSGRTDYRVLKHRHRLMPRERHNDTTIHLHLPYIGDRSMPEIEERKPFVKSR